MARDDARIAAAMQPGPDHRFDGIDTWRHYPVRAHLTHWIPRHGESQVEHQVYWYVHLGHQWPETPEIRPMLAWYEKSGGNKAAWIRADIRVRGTNVPNPPRSWQEDMWKAALEFLSRVPVPSPTLKVLHLIFSARDDVLRSITNIIRGTPALTDIVLICDTPSNMRGVRPNLNLDDIFARREPSDHLERFLLRAPALTVSARNPACFFQSLGGAHTVCLAVMRIMPNYRVWEWTLDLLNAAPKARAIEVSEAAPWDVVQYQNQTPELCKYHKINVKHLFHLIVNMYHLDGHFFTRIHAPKLKYLRVRADNDIAKAGFCEKNHFPSLLVANIWCDGSPIERFQAIGLGKSQFMHNITSDLYRVRKHNEDILAYTKEFDADVDSLYDNFPPPYMLPTEIPDEGTESVTSPEDSEPGDDQEGDASAVPTEEVEEEEGEDTDEMSSLTSLSPSGESGDTDDDSDDDDDDDDDDDVEMQVMSAPHQDELPAQNNSPSFSPPGTENEVVAPDDEADEAAEAEEVERALGGSVFMATCTHAALDSPVDEYTNEELEELYTELEQHGSGSNHATLTLSSGEESEGGMDETYF
ncbi:hypothetical protein CF319_g3685 [Tilletia indica]|nr:hypothetical protein CF319_g3685 [Tilletia indica]